MAQIAKLSVTVLAGASDQAVPHGLVATPNSIYIVEKDDATGPKKALAAQCFTKVGAAIGTAAAKVKTVAAAAFSVGVYHFAKGITDDFWILTGFNVTNGMYNICLLCIDTSGNMQIAAGTEGATAGAVVLADTPADSCVVAKVLVHPTGTGNFVGGTTDLDDGTVVPNAAYADLAGHPDLYGEITLGAAADATNVYVDNSMESDRSVVIMAARLHSIIQ
ncbi:hypothetical protein LCGC14_0565680 [marine sediment metagenome]|uniref:Uncharacterized protein n=1 Tax=marine sediment metagenome TaxID=412755 RepID=A0A0F9U733_9ZZZZ